MSEESRENRDIQDSAPHQEKPQRQFRGLYDRVNISVGTLNMVIIVLSILLVLSMGYGIAHRGYVITFDSLGGTAVESGKQMYGELLLEPEQPVREGYVFDGWYRDRDLTAPWDMQEDIVTESMTLYAGWKEK